MGERAVCSSSEEESESESVRRPGTGASSFVLLILTRDLTSLVPLTGKYAIAAPAKERRRPQATTSATSSAAA